MGGGGGQGWKWWWGEGGVERSKVQWHKEYIYMQALMLA